MCSINYNNWSKLTICEQMGNIGSEVGRAIAAKRRDDKMSLDGAVVRALDLFDATSEQLAGLKSPRLREVLRAKDQFLQLFWNDNFQDADGLERYFMQFAMAARRNR